ncbi:MAG: hypothetical protein M3O91_05490 [Chloroflexota bacterium]|nr:hypothetical protein [Chloroflexota bacterium]
MPAAAQQLLDPASRTDGQARHQWVMCLLRSARATISGSPTSFAVPSASPNSSAARSTESCSVAAAIASAQLSAHAFIADLVGEGERLLGVIGDDVRVLGLLLIGFSRLQRAVPSEPLEPGAQSLTRCRDSRRHR